MRLLPRPRRGAGVEPADDPAARLDRIDHLVDLEHGGDVGRLAGLVGFRHHRAEELVALRRVLDRLELLAEAEPHGAFEAHAAELAGRPGDGEALRVEAAAGHGLRAEPVALAQDDGEIGNVEVRRGHEHAADMAHQRGLLRLRPDHEARRVAERDDRKIEGVAELHEARRLVGGVGIDRAAEMLRVVGDEAERPALDADQGGDDSDAEGRAQLEHGAFVRQRLDDSADVVDAQPVLRDGAAQEPLVGRAPVRDPSLEIGEVAFRRRAGLDFVLDQEVDDAVRRLHADRPDLLRAIDAEAAALDHRRAAHADIRVSRGDHHVAAAEQRGVAGEAAAGDDSDERREPAEPGELREGRHVEAADAEPIRVARPAAAAFGEQDDRQALPLGEREQAVLLLVVALPLRAGEHGVVVGDDHAAGALRSEQVAVHRGEARHDAVARRVADEIVLRPARRLRRDRERAVFDETLCIDERGDVLARRAMIGLAAPRDGFRAVLVEAERLPRQHVGEILADGVGVDRLRLRLRLGAGLGRLEEQDRIVLVERVALPPAELAHDPAAGRADQMLHLHRFDHGDLLARPHDVAFGDVDRDERAGNRRADRDRAFRPRVRDCRAAGRVVFGRVEIEAAMVLRRRFQTAPAGGAR